MKDPVLLVLHDKDTPGSLNLLCEAGGLTELWYAEQCSGPFICIHTPTNTYWKTDAPPTSGVLVDFLTLEECPPFLRRLWAKAVTHRLPKAPKQKRIYNAPNGVLNKKPLKKKRDKKRTPPVRHADRGLFIAAIHQIVPLYPQHVLDALTNEDLYSTYKEVKLSQKARRRSATSSTLPIPSQSIPEET